jgi:hypothetical protein
MHPEYEKIFSTLKAPEPPAGMTEKVMHRILVRERRVLALKIGAFAVAFAASMGVVVAGGMDLMANMNSSGFLTIGGLVFSDFSAVLSNLPDFALSMVEAFPVFIAAALLGGILFAVWSMAALIDETSLMRNRHEKSFGI